MKHLGIMLFLPVVVLVTACATNGPPDSFLQSGDPRWHECLADRPGFPATELSPSEFQSALRIPWVHVHPNQSTESTTIRLPSKDVDQRTALWLYQKQTGARVEIMDNGKLEGTIRITWPGYEEMLRQESSEWKVEPESGAYADKPRRTD